MLCLAEIAEHHTAALALSPKVTIAGNSAGYHA